MSDYSAIGLQNNLHFKLRAPNQGKVKRTPNYTAYNKTTLSSIPRNVEVILIKAAQINQTSSSNNQYRHSTFGNPIIPINNKEVTNMNTNNNIIHDHISNKGYGNGFASNLNRFDGYNELKAKYSPGPGEYNNQLKQNYSNERYKSLFLKHNDINNLLKENIPGPGFYNPSNLCSSHNHITSSFKSRNVRFKELKNQKLGPGYYKKESSIRWDSKIPSSFFKEYSQKIIHNPIEKYVNTGKIIAENEPGPGHYEIKREFSQRERSVPEKQNDNKNNLSPLVYFNNSDNNKLIPDDLKEFNNLIKEEQMYRDYSHNNIQFNNKFDPMNLRKSLWKKEIRSPFLSKTKKCSIYDKAANHIPGPCYYQRSNSFNNMFIKKSKRKIKL